MKEKVVSFFSLILLLGGLGVTFFFIVSGRLDIQTVTSYLTRGHSAFLSAGLFLILFTLRPIFPIPFSIMTVAGGIVFGGFAGTILSFIGSTAGGIVDFLFARRIGSAIFKKSMEKKLNELAEIIKEKEILKIAMLRLIPFMNFDVLNYALGISGVSLKNFIIGSWIGLAPWFVTLGIAGYSIRTSNRVAFMITSALILFLMILFTFLTERMKK